MPAPSLSLREHRQSAPVDVEEVLFSLFEQVRSLKVPEQVIATMSSCDIIIFIVLVNASLGVALTRFYCNF